MTTNFYLNYGTVFGEQVAIRVNKNDLEEIIVCQTQDGFNWTGTVQLKENETITYKYFIQTDHKQTEEFGKYRTLTTPKGIEKLSVQDQWRPTHYENNAYFAAAFADVIFKRNDDIKAKKTSKSIANQVIFQLHCANLPQHLSFGIIGNHADLGNWETPVLLSSENFPTWQTALEIQDLSLDLAYKFVVLDKKNGQIVVWEDGENRALKVVFPSEKGNAILRTEDGFRFAPNQGRWRGAGVAIPVFSLRSEKGMGIGEYTDLKTMADWSAATGMKILQILPVNDTIATKAWTDSYPYAAISVFALHPLYVNLQAIGTLENKKDQTLLNEVTKKLNQLECVDFEEVLHYKFLFFKILYAQQKATFFKEEKVKKFIADNADWLHAYAAFSYLRDENKTANFNLWKKHSTFSQTVIDEVCNPKAKHFDEVALYYFIQFHAHEQLHGATEYARTKSVVLKGDLPIGIYRFSADAWVAPHLYNMNGQAGAPPDAYAEGGQNWGFPTYNWEVMAKDNFAWWQRRMTKLSEYFDALRIDHILGFFRIWQIPLEQVEGTLGLFNPRLPYSRQELAEVGLFYDFERLTKPYIREYHLHEIFGADADFVKKEFLVVQGEGSFGVSEKCDNQQKIKELFTQNEKYARKQYLEKRLMRLLGEVILIEEPNSNGTAYNPRITVNTTRSYKELPQHLKQIIDRLYSDYFFSRHDEFWKQQAMQKLPALLKATNMFICGEDLGMIPNSVPGVMRDLNIVALEIQRMPKGATAFGEPQHYPYMSVCSPSCHDMSTIRGWWESDLETSQRFWNQNLRQGGAVPSVCTPDVVELINRQHFNSPSMWAIFPIQDLVGMDKKLRRYDADAEQINNPENPKHYWRFRFHLTVEQLMKETALAERIKTMVKESGR